MKWLHERIRWKQKYETRSGMALHTYVFYHALLHLIYYTHIITSIYLWWYSIITINIPHWILSIASVISIMDLLKFLQITLHQVARSLGVFTYAYNAQMAYTLYAKDIMSKNFYCFNFHVNRLSFYLMYCWIDFSPVVRIGYQSHDFELANNMKWNWLINADKYSLPCHCQWFSSFIILLEKILQQRI